MSLLAGCQAHVTQHAYAAGCSCWLDTPNLEETLLNPCDVHGSHSRAEEILLTVLLLALDMQCQLPHWSLTGTVFTS